MKWTLVQEVGLSYGCAKKFWSATPKRALAYTFHIFKIYAFCLQLAKEQKISDFTENDHWLKKLKKIQESSQNYEEFHQKIHTDILQYEKLFKGLLSSAKSQISQLDKNFLEKTESGSLLIKYVLNSQDDFEKFQHFAGLRLKRHPKFSNLLHLTNDNVNLKRAFFFFSIFSTFSTTKPYSLMNLQSLQECNGLILDENNHFSLVSFPFKTVFDFQEIIYPTQKTHLDFMDWDDSFVNQNHVLSPSKDQLYF